MLEKAELPFSISLFSMLDDGTAIDDIPFFFDVHAEPVVDSSSSTHVVQLQMPLMASVRAMEVNSVIFKANTASASRKVYLMLQRLDSNGEPRGPPVPIAITDTTQCTVPVRVMLHAGDSIRLLLVQRGSGSCVREVGFNGFLLQSPDSFFPSSSPPAALTSWSPDHLRIVEGEKLVETRKRSRSSEMRPSRSDDADDVIPTLIYAPVIGGDDES